MERPGKRGRVRSIGGIPRLPITQILSFNDTNPTPDPATRMESFRVQIYEIQSPEEAEQAIAAGVDHIGGVVLSASAWRDDRLKAAVHKVKAAGRISSLIPLFSQLEAIRRVLDYYQPDMLHLCETLPDAATPDVVLETLLLNQRAIREAYPEVKIMRSIPIGRPGCAEDETVASLASQFEPLSDFFLTDTILGCPSDLEAQPVAGFVGITGATCDWQVARRLVAASRIPVILAGGLTPENVYQGVRDVHPAGVDSCTGTNRRDAQGKPIRFAKDWRRVQQLVQEARRAAAH